MNKVYSIRALKEVENLTFKDIELILKSAYLNRYESDDKFIDCFLILDKEDKKW